MGMLNLKQKKVVEQTPAYQLLSDFASLIDQVGELQAEAEQIKARIKADTEKLKPYKAALEQLQAAVNELDMSDDETTKEVGAHFEAVIGKRGTERTIKDLAKILEYMGEELFTQCATVPLKHIDAYLTLPQRDDVLEYSRTNHSISVVKRN